MAENTQAPILIARNVSKTFYSTKALQKVNFELLPGEVHALMGENGAGKSTLGKCITGIYQAEEGEYIYQGRKVHYNNPKEALNDGIAIVMQEFNMLPHLSVAENLFLTDDNFYKNKVFVDYPKMVKRTDELLRYFHMREIIDPMEKLANLTVAEMQIVEIIKAMSKNAKVVILDEPTATLSTKEVNRLFDMVRELKNKGVSFIIVSHKINEIYEISDRITVFRDGQLVLANAIKRELEENDLIKAMVGRQVNDLYGKGINREDKISDEIVLDVQHISDKKNFVTDCSFQVRRGEILGVSGMVGAGRTELMRCVCGIDPRSTGRVIFMGKELKKNSITSCIKAGVCYLSEKRKEEGLHQTLSIINNLNMVNTAIAKQRIIKTSVEEENCKKMVGELNIKVGEPFNAVSSLSGGNQQKILLGKWLLSNPKLLIIDEPTRGIDIASKSEIYVILRKLADRGISVVVISSEINEILGISDRVLIMREGRIVNTMARSEMTEEKIGYYATVGSEEGELA